MVGRNGVQYLHVVLDAASGMIWFNTMRTKKKAVMFFYMYVHLHLMGACFSENFFCVFVFLKLGEY